MQENGFSAGDMADQGAKQFQAGEASDTRTHSMVVLNTALEIADETCRSDVEAYAMIVRHPQGFDAYDLRYAQPWHGKRQTSEERQDEAARWVAIAKRAAKYIRARGDALPFRMLDVDGTPFLVRFVAKD